MGNSGDWDSPRFPVLLALGGGPTARSDGDEKKAIITGMEPRVLHVSEADAVRDMASILESVRAGSDVVIERDAQPVAVVRAAAPVRRTISECIALARAHEEELGQAPTLDPDFAADVEDIVHNRKPWNSPTWD